MSMQARNSCLASDDCDYDVRVASFSEYIVYSELDSRFVLQQLKAISDSMSGLCCSSAN